MRNVTVGENDLVDSLSADDIDQVALGVDRDPLGIELAGQLARVDPPLDVGDLSGREGDHLVILIVAEVHVEVVEVATCGPHDQYTLTLHKSEWSSCSASIVRRSTAHLT